MRFLVPDVTYPEREEDAPAFEAKLRQVFEECFGESVSVESVDAGPSASIPAYFIQFADIIADMLAIFAGPIVLRDGLAWWKTAFRKSVETFLKLGLNYSIDLNTAVLVAADRIAGIHDGEEIEVLSVTRHWINLGGARSEYIAFEGPEPDVTIPLDQHFAAVRQLSAHYIILVRCGQDHFTVLVDTTGTVVWLTPLM